MQILKLGGSVITRKGGYMEENQRAIAELTEMLARAWHGKVRDILLIHGAGSFGHAPVLRHGIRSKVKTPEEKKGMADTHASVSELSLILTSNLIAKGVPAVTLPPAALGRQSGGRISEFNRKLVLEYLKAGYMPVLHGDMLLDKKNGATVCSGDQMVSYFAKDAKRIIIGTDVDGVFAGTKLLPRITRKGLNEVLPHLSMSAAPDVTGGMKGKIEELLRTNKKCYVANALHPERIELLLKGKPTICTVVEKGK